jgi:hypothetical protein
VINDDDKQLWSVYVVARRSLEATRLVMKSVDYNIKYLYNIYILCTSAIVFLNIIFTMHTRQCVSVDNIFYERACCGGELSGKVVCYIFACFMIIIIIMIITTKTLTAGKYAGQ